MTGTTQGTSTTGDGAVCGDGIVEDGEACDDGDLDATDACTVTCELAACGDGHVWAGVEACDDGNILDTDACTGACEPAVCGDGIVRAGVEQCDSGGAASPLCDLDCTPASCGDGVHNPAAGEQCDDGNDVADDGCDAGCKRQVQIATGMLHTCVRLATGDARCWGLNSDGQLGDKTKVTKGGKAGDLPVANLQFAGAKVRQIYAGSRHSCALLMTGAVKCWGYYQYLGLGDFKDYLTPPNPDVKIGAPVQTLATGGAHTCALTEAGAVRCWGDGVDGRLGSGSTATIGVLPGQMPPPEVPLGGEVAHLSAGSSHTCVVLTSGAVKCWGSNTFGQLGQGHVNTIGNDPGEMPPASVALPGPAVAVAAGSDHTCALLVDGSVRCWGRNSAGKLGLGHELTIGDQPGEMPPPAVTLGGKATQIAVGELASCALLDSGKLRCWGWRIAIGAGGGGDVGDEPGEMPPPDVALGGVPVALPITATGGTHLCALLADATLRCWGQNSTGACGLPLGTWIGDDETPAQAGPVPY